MLSTTKTFNNGELLIELEGRLDTLTSPGFDDELEELLPKAEKLTLDFKNLEYISSAGLRSLLAAQQYMEDNKRPTVTVLNVNKNIRETFELTGFDSCVDAHWA